ncbi:hypothetical protein AB0958_09740 [Streptomyces sp. NPDC006655]|uniref:hypothetical protein n=1 Tax=Streptomyces sp. NPDC006655 TaxID=3156898 RepID=UPI00345494C3
MNDRPTASTITDEQLDALYVERDRLKAAILDIDAHATPMGLADPNDPEGNPHHYAVTVGALHRALGKVGHTAAPCTAEAAIERVRALHRKANNGTTCVYCAHGQRVGYDTDWPCDTIRALDGTEPTPEA